VLIARALPWTHEDCNYGSVIFAFGEEIVASSVTVEIAPGELIDKITILEIKLERIKDTAKLANVRTEWETLTKSRDEAFENTEKLAKLTADLKAINEDLWVIEDDIRDCERAKDFSDTFVQLARTVYVTNDRRAGGKRAINELLGSRLMEEKSYADYT
jgi:hypothetical protein